VMASEGKILDVPIRLGIPLQDLAALCRKYNVEELAVFGSALRDDFRADSDVDFLVRFQDDDAGPWLVNLTGLQQEIADLLHRPVDVVDWKGVEQSRNPFRRTSILRGLKTLYVA
jgi:predicted nucleotidyltransferase